MRIIETKAFTVAQVAVEEPQQQAVEPFAHPDKPNKAHPLDMPYWWYKKQILKIPDDPKTIWPLGEYKNIHGFFCGPGPVRDKSCQMLLDGKPLPKPVDDLDCACMEHDLDYCKAGLGWKEAYGFSITPEAGGADKKFINTIRKLQKEKKLNWYTHMKSNMILGFFVGRQNLPAAPTKPVIAHQSPQLPYDETEKPCTSCSRSAAKQLAESSAR